MTTTEDRLRDAFRADAQTIAADSIRARATLADGLESATGGRAGGPGSAWSRRRRLLVPLSAAVAALAVVAAVGLAGSGRSDRSPLWPGVQGPYVPSSAARSAPPYFVGLLNQGLGVYNAWTGRRIELIRTPRPGFWWEGAAATGNDRVFVVATTPKNHGCYTDLYRLSLTAGGRLGSLTPLAVPRVAGHMMGDTALASSANGQVIGYSTLTCSRGHGWAGVIRLPSRQDRRWPLSSELVLSLSMSPGGQTLFFDDQRDYGGDGTIRALPTRAPVGLVTRRARIVLPASSGLDQIGSVVTDRGTTLLGCLMTRRAGVLASYSVATGRKLAVLHTWRHADGAFCQLSVTPSGGYALVTGTSNSGSSRLNLHTSRSRTIPTIAAGIAW
jgi:hypothetical protein